MAEADQEWRAWKRNWEQAQFRGAIFFVETDNRSSGRRVAVHQYPKRNTPYAEDMGRSAIRVHVQGYLIGHPGSVADPEKGTTREPVSYLQLKDNLILALEADGPGLLRLPMQFQKNDMMVMVMSYSVTESRERGGMCMVEMDFVEYGDPAYRTNISTSSEIMKSSAATERAVTPPPTPTTPKEVAPFVKIHNDAELGSA